MSDYRNRPGSKVVSDPEFHPLGYISREHFDELSKCLSFGELVCPNGHRPDEILNLHGCYVEVCHECSVLWPLHHSASTGQFYDQQKVKQRIEKLMSSGYERVCGEDDPRLVHAWYMDQQSKSLECTMNFIERDRVSAKSANCDDVLIYVRNEDLHPKKLKYLTLDKTPLVPFWKDDAKSDQSKEDA